MKFKALLCGLLLSVATFSWAQLGYYENTVVNTNGNPIPHAWVRICAPDDSATPCTPTAILHSDLAGQHAISNPLQADQHGFYEFYTVPSDYLRQVYSSNTLTESRGFSVSSGPTAAIATALAATPTGCSLPQVATGVAANGNANCAQPSNITGNATTATSANSSTNLAGGTLGAIPFQSGPGATALLSGNASDEDQVVVSHGNGSDQQAPTLKHAPALSAANMTDFPQNIVSLNGATQTHQTFVAGNNINIQTDTSLGTHSFSVTGLAPLALSGLWADVLGKPTTFPPSLPTSTTPGGVYIPVSCPPVTDPLTSASVPQHIYGINTSTGQLLCSPDNNWDLQLQVNGTTVAAGVRAINFVGSSGMHITAASNTGTGVVTYTVTGSTATQAQSPTLSPLPGAYSRSQNVTLACASPSPTIYYTTDGSTPTHSSSSYSSPISISAGTIKAICASSGLADSNEADGVYSQTAPIATLSASSLTFGNQLVGSASTAQTNGLHNTGNATLTISSFSFTGTNAADFSESDDCGGSLTAGASCTVSVTFTPSASGSRTATLNVNDNASDTPQTVSLTGTGALPTGGVSPSTLTYTSTAVGSSSGSQTVTLSNSGTVPMTVSSVALSGTNAGDYSQTNNCTGVPASGSCYASVVFSPTAGGTRTATLTFTSNASNSPQTVSITGTGTSPAASISPSSLTYSSQIVGTSSASQAVTIQNTGSTNLGFSSIGITGANSGDFAQSNNCTTLTPTSSCTVNVTFTPQATGSRSAALSLTDNAPGSPQTVSLSGTGVIATVTVSPSSLTFQQVQGVTSVSQAVTLHNTSSYTDTISSIAITSDYAQTNNCGTSLAGGASCTINVTFTPSVLGTDNGTLTITDNASGSPHTVSLSGTGLQAINFVNSNGTHTTIYNGSASYSCTAGNLLVAIWINPGYGTSPITPTFSDTQGNSWQTANSVSTYSGSWWVGSRIFYAARCVGGTGTISSTNGGVAIYQFSGLSATPLDAVGGSTGTSSTASCSVTASNQGELIFAYAYAWINTPSFGPASGFTLRGIDSNNAEFDSLSGSAGTNTVSTAISNGLWLCNTVAFH